jgi:hypothetical protein
MKLPKAILGDYYDFVVHIVRSTLVFIIVLGCIFVARLIVPKLFPPGDYTSKALHLVDSYATLLGTVGYVVWLSLDMYFLIRERITRVNKQEDQGDDERPSNK